MDPITTHSWHVSGMHCSSCSILIDEAVEEIPGVTSSTTSLRKKLTKVTFDPARCDPEQVATAIRSAGYQPTPAEQEPVATRRSLFRRSPR